ncbi:hypothetical protein BC939DRAFT_457719 [Gamsiella multidivaricata]|uniref:uncharacterized protein n=1 Tax=Gamsiella multidivaricata TaxID=101098 RepID=UPI00221E4F15|nr:uncharacterized protein BC939DRAFT_457719 [Gamsiella multidivaricata]KAG0362357.1 hypothetical protein BGZ54_008659 [Gamsiella multidivaricata]KAI7820567.1 hypothetical protein BC939DRAFT_457719 [Gamsiella multidivaricata]
MSNYNDSQRYTSNSGRAPNPAKNRQIPNDLRANGTNGVLCFGCGQTKTRLAFSETQLKKAANKKHQIMCKSCIPAQPTTLRCIRCSKSLPMDSFSKTQRKRQEKATCIECRTSIDEDDSQDDFDIEEDPDWYEGDIRDIL